MSQTSTKIFILSLKLTLGLLVLGWFAGSATSTAIPGELDQVLTDESNQQDLDPDESAPVTSKNGADSSEWDDIGAADEDDQQEQADLVKRSDEDGYLDRAETNIKNAQIRVNPEDMATAAGHHHHHGHYAHGKLDMGAHSGKKGAFGWHAKYPVGKGKK